MIKVDSGRLIYRRQFLLTSKTVSGLDGWSRHEMCGSKKTLYVHPDLEITRLEEKNRRITLLGYLFDWRNPAHKNEDILRSVFAHKSRIELIESTYEYSGRFAIIYESEEGCIIFNDAGGQREIYYNVGEYGISCASQLPILKEHIGLERNDDERPIRLFESLDFKKSKNQWVGENTLYKATKWIKPNFYLDIDTGNTVRYWPLSPLKPLSLDAASEMGAAMLKGFLDAASRRSKLSIPVTGGWDSRLLLAASRDIQGDAVYFVIKFPWMDENHRDIRVPRKLMKTLGRDFSVIEAGGEVDAEFRRIFTANIEYCREGNLVGIYNVLHGMFDDRMNISSHVSEIVRSYRGTIRKPSGSMFSTYIGYDGNNEYVSGICQEWIDKNMQNVEKMRIDAIAIFCWEECISWEATHRSETDIAVDEFCPFSSRSLISTLLSVKPKYRNEYTCRLYKKMMKIMWPEVLLEPINPSPKRLLKGMLVDADILTLLKQIKLIKKDNYNL